MIDVFLGCFFDEVVDCDFGVFGDFCEGVVVVVVVEF